MAAYLSLQFDRLVLRILLLADVASLTDYERVCRYVTEALTFWRSQHHEDARERIHKKERGRPQRCPSRTRYPAVFLAYHRYPTQHLSQRVCPWKPSNAAT